MAEALTEANQEQTEPDASGAATTNDEAPAEPDARGAADINLQAPCAEATAAVANQGTTPAGKIQCPCCPKTFDSERALRSHARHCKKTAAASDTPGAPAATALPAAPPPDAVPPPPHAAPIVCTKCNGLLKSAHGLMLHERGCNGTRPRHMKSAPQEAAPTATCCVKAAQA